MRKVRNNLFLGAAVFLPMAIAGTTSAYVLPERPRAFVDTTLPGTAGTCTINVPSGGDLQAAIDRAAYGDTICLDAGGTYVGNYILKDKASGSGWITIRTATPDSLLPPDVRVSPDDASKLAKILIPPLNKANPILSGFRTQWHYPVHHYRLIGLEVTITAGSAPNWMAALPLIMIDAGGDTSYVPRSPIEQPHHIVVDRCFLHGTPTDGAQTGVLLNGTNDAVIDSYISDIHSWFEDPRGIMMFNSPGPHKIVNNFIEAGGENIMHGGAPAQGATMNPSDIEIRHNYLHKAEYWRNLYPQWLVKNLLEFKNGQRALIDGNIFDGNWTVQQQGWGILLGVRSSDNPDANVYDLTFTNNILKNTERGVNFLGMDYACMAPDGSLDTTKCGRIGQEARILFQNNYLEVGQHNIYGSGQVNLGMGTSDVTFDHNTMVFPPGKDAACPSCGTLVFAADDGGSFNKPSVNFNFVNNLSGPNVDRFSANSALINPVINHNLIFQVSDCILAAFPGCVPAPGNYLTVHTGDAGFVNSAIGNWRLSAGSPYKNQASDGTDPGANLDAVAAATSGVFSGNRSNFIAPTAPFIFSFIASTPTVAPGQSTLLYWSTNWADSVSIDNGVGNVPNPDGGTVTVTPGQTTTYTLSATNGRGTTVTKVTVAVGNVGSDTTPPVVSWVSPSAGAQVAGVVPLVATASDNMQVAKVQFSVNGIDVGTALSAPYAINWYSTGNPLANSDHPDYQALVANGNHTITATATDAAGNSSVASLTVNLQNPALQSDLPPSVVINDPCPTYYHIAGCAPIRGTVSVDGWAMDNIWRAEGLIAKVDILMDGQAVGTATYGISNPDVCNSNPNSIACPNVGFQYSLDTRAFSDGPHILHAVATDGSGKTTDASANVFISNNGTVPAPPVIDSLNASPNPASSGQTILSAVIHGGVPPFNYAWTQPDGVTLLTTAASPIVDFLKTGAYAFTLTIIDAVNNTVTQTLNNVVAPNVLINLYVEYIFASAPTGPYSANKIYKFGVSGLDQFHSPIALPDQLSWSTDGKAKIDPFGNFTAFEQGTYHIQVRSGNALSSPVAITVTGGPAAGSSVSPNYNIRVYPNPWRKDKYGDKIVTFDQMAVGSQVKLFTTSGHLIRTLGDLQFNGNTYSTTWDLKNNHGEKVASGIYLFVVDDNQGHKARGKLAVLR